MDTTTALTTIALRWTDLRTALTTHNASWPPAGRADILRALDELDATDAAHLRADGIPLRTVAAPIDLTVLDLMTLTESALVDCADHTAAVIQRSPMSRAPRDWPATDRARRDALADADRDDRRRWRYTGHRTAPHAALWLYGRITNAGGPFALLSDDQHHDIATVARTAASRVEQALDITGQVAQLTPPCPDCGGTVQMHGGAGARPVAHCVGCGRTWAEQPIPA
ncbi:hypothetical protein [Streptomyces sp. NBC_01506]|uniref:hypothetical protein n=1 Tax=Streptomyces sp. NBC_01506 TaxID=2903887 RepID=UPI003869CEFD